MKSQESWNAQELKVLKSFKTPMDVQEYLNKLNYSTTYECKSPRRVMKENNAACVDGALFAAAALEFMGYEPLIVDLEAVQNEKSKYADDDHVIAIYKEENMFGAVAKSNTTLLRFREPVYKSIREVVMSYYEFYFNVNGYKSLRRYSKTVNLEMFNNKNWRTSEEDMEFIVDYLFKVKHYDIAGKKAVRNLSKADPDVMKACFLGAVEEGLYKPEKK